MPGATLTAPVAGSSDTPLPVELTCVRITSASVIGAPLSASLASTLATAVPPPTGSTTGEASSLAMTMNGLIGLGPALAQAAAGVQPGPGLGTAVPPAGSIAA